MAALGADRTLALFPLRRRERTFVRFSPRHTLTHCGPSTRTGIERNMGGETKRPFMVTRMSISY
jgi:hypothetical protein